MLTIITAPNPILSQTAKPCAIRGSTSRYAPVPNRMVLGRYGANSVSKINTSVLKLIEGMKQTLLAAKDPEGVGLAAPQVGHPLQLFITKPTPKSSIYVFINPKISLNEKITHLTVNDDRQRKLNKTAVKKSQTKLEGCLSLPNIWGEVIRDPHITISYLDEKGNTHNRKFKALFATIIQHEIDHLNGILFPKRVLEQKRTLYKSHKDEKGEDVFEEIEL